MTHLPRMVKALQLKTYVFDILEKVTEPYLVVLNSLNEWEALPRYSESALYYITNDNELYVLDNPRADKDQTATKVIDDEVIEFLGIETKEVEDGYWKIAVYKKLAIISKKLDNLESNSSNKTNNIQKHNSKSSLKSKTVSSEINVI